MTKAYSYIRFSHSQQVKGDSLRRQIELSEKYALENNLELDTTLNFMDLGVSAYDGSNKTKGALGDFLTIVNQGKIPKGSFLLVESLDRLSREKVLEAFSTFTNILSAGISIVTLTDNQVFTYESANGNFASLLISLSTMYRANEESAVKSKRIRASWDNKRKKIEEKILTGRCPYWLKPSDDYKRFEFIEDRVEIVKRIFKMAKDGYGNSLIVKTLNNEQIAPFSKKTDGWQTSYIQKLLSNPAIYGEVTLKLQRDGESTVYKVIPNYYPALMSYSEWSDINLLRAGRKTQRGTNRGENISNLFSGLLKCQYCKGPMNMAANTKKKNGVVNSKKYVACSRARRGLGCKFIKWDYQDLENQLLTFSTSIEFHNILTKENSTIDNEIENLKQTEYSLRDTKINIQSMIENLMQAIEQANTPETPRTIIDRINKLEIELTQCDISIDEVTKKIDGLLSEKASQKLRFQESINIVNELQKKSGEELYDLRVKLSSSFKSAVKEIFLSPGGNWFTEKHIALLNEVYGQESSDRRRLKKYLSKMDTNPNREKRSFTIHFRNGDYRVVRDGSSLSNDDAYVTDYFSWTKIFEL